MPNIGPLEILILLFLTMVGAAIALVVWLVARSGNKVPPIVPTDSGTAGAPTNPPGWHPDPITPGQMRWWDGSRWTEDVSTPSGGGPPVKGPLP